MTTQPPITPDEYVALRAAVGWASADESTITQALHNTLAWAIERDENGQLIGLARVVGDGLYALVVDVMVHPRAQGTGLGPTADAATGHQPVYRAGSSHHPVRLTTCRRVLRGIGQLGSAIGDLLPHGHHSYVTSSCTRQMIERPLTLLAA